MNKKNVIYVNKRDKLLKTIIAEEEEKVILESQLNEINSKLNARNNQRESLGKIKDNTTSLYKIADSKNHRLVYDFPKSISTQKGLQMDEEGNVLFIGINNSDGSEDVFKCTTKGDLSIIKNPASEYAFVKIKN